MRDIPLTHGFVALVDDADYEWLSALSWFAHRDRTGLVYALRRVRPNPGERRRQRCDFMHNVILGSKGVDHRNGDGLDNRRANLRHATTAQNNANRRVFRNNTSGFKGVSFHRGHGRWQAYVRVNGRCCHLGYFDTREAAALAHDDAARREYGEFATLNFPREGERSALIYPERTVA